MEHTKPIDFDSIDTEHLQRIIAVLKKQLERTDKHACTGKPREINNYLLQQYQTELERRNNKTDEH